MPEGLQVADGELIRLERDLYLRLLNLGSLNELEPFLEQALKLVTEVASAHQGYLELSDEKGSGNAPRWWAAHGFGERDIEAIRSSISRGIVAEALATGQTIVSDSALLDPRFGSRDSIRASRIEAVLCAPIGQDPPIGVLYLQRREQPGSFSESDRMCVETVARHLAPLADRLVSRRQKREDDDATRPLRERLRLDGVIGRSPVLAALLRKVASITPLDVNVLLTGESGTGKSQIARVIHDNSPRAGHPFVELNCGAIPEALVESELFGSLAGAHSTATRSAEGKVAAAEHGTLFLDEIGELPLASQPKLLKLLDSGTYYPLGGTRPLRADVRVIAATNLDLEAAVKERRFRDDLYYRLNVIRFRVPSLTERREDIPDLASYFCARACERHHLPRLSLSPQALRQLENLEWPGNIRELDHAVVGATILAASEGAAQVERSHLFPDAATSEKDAPVTFQQATHDFQSRLVRNTLEETGWNIVNTARRLDLTRSHVYNLIRAFGLERKRR